MTPCRISVAVAAYRGEAFIGEQLASIAAQTVIPDEVVICDDSPDDLTENAVMKYRETLNIRYFRNPAALGVAGNFNRALSLCAGEVVFLCDQDDVWYPEKVARMMKLFDLGAQAVFCDSDITDGSGKTSGFTHLQSRGYGLLRTLPEGKYLTQFADSCRRFPAAGHDMALSGALLKKLLPLPELDACHDNYLGLAAAALDEWFIVPQSLGIFRRHGRNSSGAGEKISFAGQLQAARKSVKENTFQWNADLFQAVIDRLPELPADRQQMLSQRQQHSASRAAMNKGFFRRLPLVLHEWLSGNYSRFGRGWKNLVQDIFLR